MLRSINRRLAAVDTKIAEDLESAGSKTTRVQITADLESVRNTCDSNVRVIEFSYVEFSYIEFACLLFWISFAKAQEILVKAVLTIS
jgi:hypothetical protein